MAERVLRGTPASPGVGLGTAWGRAEPPQSGIAVAPEDRASELDLALAALAAAAQALAEVAARLGPEEAEIIETGVLMAQDPALAAAVRDAVTGGGLPAPAALLRATGEHADAIAAIPDATLAARADDVRSLGRRAARLATSGGAAPEPGADAILIASDLGPGDVAELAPSLAGVALTAGAATSHAAIVARSLGIPMVAGLGAELLDVPDGACLAVDGGRGSLIVDPAPDRARNAAGAMRARREAERRAYAARDRPATTRDGRRVAVLANVASVEELRVALRAGAEGIGLLRTELAFLCAERWPAERDHADALEPVLAELGPHRAIVRVLDFGADKSPPFLRGTAARGLELLLAHGDAFSRQLRAILRCGRGRDLRILLPMVDTADQVRASRALLDRAAGELGLDVPPALGSMIETERAVENAVEIAAQSDFLSIGTNDLTAATLGVDRFAGGSARSHHPAVLRAIARGVAAAQGAGIAIEVCGEAASEPVMLPLLVGLGVDELSVGAARVGTVREWIRGLDAGGAARLARSALARDTAEQVARAVALSASASASASASVSVEDGDGRGERGEGSGGVGALGA
jgi:phosphoenolpyruvate-protein kinase (PTS system EI component)